jgi:hypothetical protein
MIVYTVLFTLVGKDPAENRYVEMFYIWLTHILKNAGLVAGDKICVLIDKPTIDFLNVENNIGFILSTCRISIEFWLINQPNTPSEGMVQKYNIEDVPAIVSDCSLYLDLDIVIKAPLTPVRELIPDTLAVVMEGNIYNDDYGGKVLPREPEKEGYPGFSAALFAFSVGETVREFMRCVKGDCLAQDPPFYTVEQPFFNKYLYQLFIDRERPFFMIPKKYVSNNDMAPSDSVVFVNYCGDPGNGPMHVVKMIMAMCMGLLLTDQRTAPSPPPEHPAPPLGLPQDEPLAPQSQEAVDEGQGWPAPSEA